MLKLYHAEPAANSLKTLISFKEKELGFESIYVDLHRFEQHEPGFLAVNPDGQVPVVDHDGNIITQSTVIGEYLEDAFPDAPPLRPADALGRARMRQWNKFCDEHVFSHVSLHGWNRMITALARSIDPQEFERRVERIPLHEQRVKWRAARAGFDAAELANARRKIEVGVDKAEQQLAQTPWIAGTMYTLADINWFANCGMAVARLLPDCQFETRAPRFMDWVRRVRERPAVKAALAMQDRRDPALRALSQGRGAA